MAGHGLSKSRIVAWKQCPKRLWLQIHKRDLLEVSDEAERCFQIGYEVGEVAQGLFHDGIQIGDDDDLSAALESTQMAMAAHPDRPNFEATFEHDGVLVRADLLLPTPSGYRMVEVKSSANVKPYHLEDCAIQAWVLQQNGIPLAAIDLAHIDTAFVYQGDGNYQGLFHHAPLNELVYPLVELVPG
jgi:predicted RecB family nuclease